MADFSNIFKIKDTDESLKAKSNSFNFGLNTGSITEFICKKTEKEGEEDLYSVNITFSVGNDDKKIFLGVTPGRKVFAGSEQLSPGEDGYDEALIADYIQSVAVIKHALKAVGVSDQVIENKINQLDPSPDAILDGIAELVALAPANMASKKVDAFLEWQWSIPKDKDRTFLTLPKNMKGGTFLVAHQAPVGKWTEVRTEKELHYVDNSGNKHAFTRDENFLSGNKGNQQTLKGNQESGASATPSNTFGSPEAKKSVWGAK